MKRTAVIKKLRRATKNSGNEFAITKLGKDGGEHEMHGGGNAKELVVVSSMRRGSRRFVANENAG